MTSTPYVEIWAAGARQVRMLAGTRFTVGRHSSNDLVLAHDTEVSRLHALFEFVGPAWVVRDQSSRNGTIVNGERIGADRPLRDGDEVRIGATRLVFRGPDDGAPIARTVGSEAPPTLTPRERDVLLELFRHALGADQFTQPATTRDIAAALFVSEAAVKQHLSNLYDKFGFHAGVDRRRTRLANEALRRGAVSLADVRARFGPG